MMDVRLEKPRGILRWLQLYRLYLTAFPAAERKPFGIIVKMYRQGKADVWAVVRAGCFAGMAATINGSGLILLDYFAVTKSRRGTGVGTAALAALQAKYHDRGLFVEIESTDAPADNQDQRENESAFTRRPGWSRCM